jgi:hypothetical protein
LLRIDILCVLLNAVVHYFLLGEYVMFDVQTISIVIAAMSVVIGVINSMLASRRAEQQRQMQLFMGIYGRFHAEDFRRSALEILSMERMGYDEAMKDRELQIHGSKLLSYFEGVGVLVSRNLIDIDLVEDLMGNHIVQLWEIMKPGVQEMRKRVHPKEANAVESLYNAIKNYRQQEATISS